MKTKLKIKYGAVVEFKGDHSLKYLVKRITYWENGRVNMVLLGDIKTGRRYYNCSWFPAKMLKAVAS